MSDQLNSPAYFAIIPANVRYDKNLCANSKLLYGEITALCHKEGYCWSSNRYFANLYDVEIRTINRWLSGLENCGYIEVHHETRGANDLRKIYLKNVTPPMTKMSYPHDKKDTPPGQKRHALYKEEKDNENNTKQQREPAAGGGGSSPSKETELKVKFLEANADKLKLTQTAKRKLVMQYRLYHFIAAAKELSNYPTPRSYAATFVAKLKEIKALYDELDRKGGLEAELRAIGMTKVVDDNGSYWILSK